MPSSRHASPRPESPPDGTPITDREVCHTRRTGQRHRRARRDGRRPRPRRARRASESKCPRSNGSAARPSWRRARHRPRPAARHPGRPLTCPPHLASPCAHAALPAHRTRATTTYPALPMLDTRGACCFGCHAHAADMRRPSSYASKRSPLLLPTPRVATHRRAPPDSASLSLSPFCLCLCPPPLSLSCSCGIG